MSRRDIYYWKCDRPAAFHGTHIRAEPDGEIEQQLREELRRHFDVKEVDLRPGAGQGNHLTWNSEVDGKAMFVRVENGPERDGQLAIESAVLDHAREAGVPTPRVFACDASRSRVPFAWQTLERIPFPDLNHWFKRGHLDNQQIAFEIGAAVARWQVIQPEGFGVLEHDDVGRVWRQPARLFAGVKEPGGSAKERNVSSESHPPNTPGLRGCRPSYADYFHLRLEEHLHSLVKRGFLSSADEIMTEIESRRALLDLPQGCLVHKDLALWNVLGSRDHVAAFIDFDDAISGDPMDDLSLLACFHDAAFLQRSLAGYQSVRPLPSEHRRRFWLHLLRNMIVKAVIRLGAGYFERDSGFFLIGTGSSGADLRRFTLERLQIALRGLREDADISTL